MGHFRLRLCVFGEALCVPKKLSHQFKVWNRVFSRSVRQVSRLAVDDFPGSRLVNAEVIFVIGFEICFLRRLKVRSSCFVWLQKKSPKNLDDLHFNHHRLVLHLPGLFQKFDFPGRLIFQSSGENWNINILLKLDDLQLSRHRLILQLKKKLQYLIIPRQLTIQSSARRLTCKVSRILFRDFCQTS